jgi:hypothetical protein
MYLDLIRYDAPASPRQDEIIASSDESRLSPSRDVPRSVVWAHAVCRRPTLDSTGFVWDASFGPAQKHPLESIYGDEVQD